MTCICVMMFGAAPCVVSGGQIQEPCRAPQQVRIEGEEHLQRPNLQDMMTSPPAARQVSSLHNNAKSAMQLPHALLQRQAALLSNKGPGSMLRHTSSSLQMCLLQQHTESKLWYVGCCCSRRDVSGLRARRIRPEHEPQGQWPEGPYNPSRIVSGLVAGTAEPH